MAQTTGFYIHITHYALTQLLFALKLGLYFIVINKSCTFDKTTAAVSKVRTDFFPKVFSRSTHKMESTNKNQVHFNYLP